MLFYLGNYLNETVEIFSFLRLVDSIVFRALSGALTALVLTILLGNRVILYMYKIGHRDNPRDYLNFYSSGKDIAKPIKTYGGPLLVGVIFVSSVLWCKVHTGFVVACLTSFVFFGILGWIDDSMKVRFGNSDKGLSEKKKLVLQIFYCTAFGFIYISPHLTPLPVEYATLLYLPFLKYPITNLAWFYVPFIAFTITAISNSVNIADGIDGLAIVPVAFVVGVMGVFAYISSHARFAEFLIFPFMPGVGEIAVICSVVFGACLGFLWFNSYPANVIMGDTGSMALGGLLGTISVLVKQEFLFVIVGGVFVFEAFSVLLQDKLGVKWLGRRFFSRAPVHHHFQQRGLADTKIVVRFWIVAGILALCGLATVKIR